MTEIRVLDLFSGIGGISLGLRKAGGFRTVCYVEIEAYCQEVLLHRMEDGSLDPAPIFEDITRVQGHHWKERVDLICGGFPCQDLSVAGKREGIDGARSGLWSEFARIIGEVRPRVVLVENVSGLLIRGLGRVIGDLASLGYDAEWDCIPASAVGAHHQRDRVWIVAYPQSNLRGASGNEGSESSDGSNPPVANPTCERTKPAQQQRRRGSTEQSCEDVGDSPSPRLPQGGRKEGGSIRDEARGQEPERRGGEVADTDSSRISSSRPDRRMGRKQESITSFAAETSQWDVEPDVGRVAHGVPSRVDRLKGLGNAVVPQVVEWIGRRIRRLM